MLGRRQRRLGPIGAAGTRPDRGGRQGRVCCGRGSTTAAPTATAGGPSGGPSRRQLPPRGVARNATPAQATTSLCVRPAGLTHDAGGRCGPTARTNEGVSLVVQVAASANWAEPMRFPGALEAASHGRWTPLQGRGRTTPRGHGARAAGKGAPTKRLAVSTETHAREPPRRCTAAAPAAASERAARPTHAGHVV